MMRVPFPVLTVQGKQAKQYTSKSTQHSRYNHRMLQAIGAPGHDYNCAMEMGELAKLKDEAATKQNEPHKIKGKHNRITSTGMQNTTTQRTLVNTRKGTR